MLDFYVGTNKEVVGGVHTPHCYVFVPMSPCLVGITNGHFIHTGPLLERGWSFYFLFSSLLSLL